MRILLCLILIISACQSETKNGNQKLAQNKVDNALDTILGDKVISNDGKIKRSNNFKSLLKIPALNLQKPSKIYDIKPIGKDLYLIHQKKNYSKARLFDLVVLVKDEKIINYFLLNDYKIVDTKLINNELYILSSNFQNTNENWKSDNEIKIIKLDSDLKVIWKYSAKNSSHMLDGNELRIDNGKTKALINVITGCHICYSIVELEIDQNGNCINVVEKNKHNSSVDIKQKELETMFNMIK